MSSILYFPETSHNWSCRFYVTFCRTAAKTAESKTMLLTIDVQTGGGGGVLWLWTLIIDTVRAIINDVVEWIWPSFMCYRYKSIVCKCTRRVISYDRVLGSFMWGIWWAAFEPFFWYLKRVKQMSLYWVTDGFGVHMLGIYLFWESCYFFVSTNLKTTCVI